MTPNAKWRVLWLKPVFFIRSVNPMNRRILLVICRGRLHFEVIALTEVLVSGLGLVAPLSHVLESLELCGCAIWEAYLAHVSFLRSTSFYDRGPLYHGSGALTYCLPI